MSASHFIRRFWAILAMAFGAYGLITRDPKALAAGGAFGIMWTAWDLFMGWVVEPLVDLGHRMLQGGMGHAPGNLRPTLNDTIRLLETHLANDDANASVRIQSALRLEDIYRMKGDVVGAAGVLARALALYPEEPRLLERQRMARDGIEPPTP